MTSSWSFFKALSWPRFIRMNLLFGLEMLALVVMSIVILVSGTFESTVLFYSLNVWTMLLLAVTVIQLAVYNERSFVSSTFRAVPLVDWKFYVLNLASSLANLVYLMLLQALAISVAFLIGRNDFETYNQPTAAVMQAALANGRWWQLLLGCGLMLLLGALLIWSTITLVHFVTDTASSLLMRFRRRFVNVVLSIIVILIALRLAGILIGTVSYLSTAVFSQGSLDSMWSIALVLTVTILVEGGVNGFLLTKWIEPKIE